MKIRKILSSLAVASALASSAFGAFSVVDVSSFTFDNSRDKMTGITFPLNGQERTLTLIYNDEQTDPTIAPFDASELFKKTGYACDWYGKDPFKCTARHFYTGIVWSSNSVGGQVNIDKAKLESLNRDIVLLDRKNVGRTYLPNNTTFMRVYIDKDGYLNAEFTRFAGGTSRAKTAKPIPFLQNVYIQANESGEAYEVAWKNIQTGEISKGYESQQFASLDKNLQRSENEHSIYKPSEDIISLDPEFSNTDLKLLYNDFGLKKFFWSTKKPLFANLDKSDLSDMPFHQVDNSLKLDEKLANKIVGDLFLGQNNFDAKDLRIYVDSNENILAIDIREKF